jgi:predicted DNA-binding protein (MmcQ/YjbR family)
MPMTRQDLIEYCLTFPAAYEDYPFDDVTLIIRHSGNKKMFAFPNETDGRLSITVKCEPMEADFLRQAFKDVIPGYHMNKKHWNTVITGGDVPEEEIKRQIGMSYDLIKPKVRRTKNAKI